MHLIFRHVQKIVTGKAVVAVLIYWRHLLARSQDRPGEYVIFNGCSLATGYPLTV